VLKRINDVGETHSARKRQKCMHLHAINGELKMRAVCTAYTLLQVDWERLVAVRCLVPIVVDRHLTGLREGDRESERERARDRERKGQSEIERENKRV